MILISHQFNILLCLNLFSLLRRSCFICASSGLSCVTAVGTTANLLLTNYSATLFMSVPDFCLFVWESPTLTKPKTFILVLTFSLFVGRCGRGKGRGAGLLDGQPQLCIERLQFCVEYLNCRGQLSMEGVQSKTEPGVELPHHVVAARLLRPNPAVVLTLTHRQAAQCHFSSHCKSTTNNLSLYRPTTKNKFKIF